MKGRIRIPSSKSRTTGYQMIREVLGCKRWHQSNLQESGNQND